MIQKLLQFEGVAGVLWRAASAVLLGWGLTACGNQTREVRVVPAPAGPQIVSVYTFDEYTDLELLKEFTARTGIHVDLKFYDETDEMVENLKSNPGEYDIFLTEDGYIQLLAAKRMMKPLDRSRLPHWKNLDPRRLDQPFDPGNEFSVPYLWGTTLVAYRKDLIRDPAHSWKQFFDPALKDKISFMNERMECYAGVLRSMGTTLPDANEQDIRKAADAMVVLLNEHGLRLGGEREVKDYLLNGNCAMTMMFSGDAVRLAEENPDIPIGYFIPEEGATVWTDSFCISRDTKRLDNAYQFLDFMLEAKSAAASSNFAHYASPNLAAAPYLLPALLANQTINPPDDILAKCHFFKLKSLDSQREVNLGWRRVQEAWLLQSGQVSANGREPGAADAETPAPAP